MAITCDDCGCCAGTDSETPRRLDNPPGQRQIGYRVGTHARFKESLLARLSSSDYPALGRLLTRDDGDFSIALCDAAAVTLDILTFYQERIANEHYLRTATERRSVLAMAELIGYQLAPGVAAATHLAFLLRETPGDRAQALVPVPIPVGTQAQSIPGPDEFPQTFETVEPIEARVEWNGFSVQTDVRWIPGFGDTDLYLSGTDNRIEPGDVILIVGKHRKQHPGSEHWDVRVVTRVEADIARQRTRLVWADPLGHGFPFVRPAQEAVELLVFRRRAGLFGANAPDPNLMSTRDSNLGELIENDPTNSALKRWKNYRIDPERIDLDVSYPEITVGSWFALVSNEEGLGRASLPGYVELYRAEQVGHPTRSDFGMSAKVTRLTPDTRENLTASRYDLKRTLVLAASESLPARQRPLFYPLYGEQMALGGLVEGLVAGQHLAFSGRRQRLQVAAGVNSLSLVADAGADIALAEGDSLRLLEPPAKLVRGDPVSLSPEAFGAIVGEQSTRLRLAVMHDDGTTGILEAPGVELAFAHAREDDPMVREIVAIADSDDAVSADQQRTRLRLASALTHCYDRDSVTINANVARATHGETVQEMLGSGNAAAINQVFALRQPPLTWVSAATPSGRASTVTTRVNEVAWSEVATLYNQPAAGRVFALRQDAEGVTTVQFGNGVEGGRLPSGQSNVRASYRKGLGVGGNLPALSIANLLTRPLGVTDVINPVPATGGEDPEALEDARQNAPVTVRTLDRAVSVTDYADFARAFAGVDKAHALWIASGPGRGVFLTVAGIGGAALPQSSDTYGNLVAALRQYGDPLVPLRVVDHRPVHFRVELAVKVAPEYETDAVLAAVEQALRDGFSFRARAFGQPVTLDEVSALTHKVAGVTAAKVLALYHDGPGVSPSRQFRLIASLPLASPTEVPVAAELLTLADAPLGIEVMA